MSELRSRVPSAFGVVALLFLATAAAGPVAAAQPAIQDLREALEEAVERQELCAAAAKRPVPPPYCSEASWADQCAELQRTQRWLAARARPLVVPEEARSLSQVHFENSDMLLTLFAGAVGVDLLCADGDDQNPPDPTESLWSHRDSLAGAIGAYETGLDLEQTRVRLALAELNHLVKLFREFKSQVERAEVEREDDLVPSLSFGATRSADGDDFMRMFCGAMADESRAAIDTVAAFSTAFEAHALARFQVERARAVLRNGLSMSAWGREEMLDCDVAVEAPDWLTGDRTLRAGEQIAVPALPGIARVDVARHPFDRRFVSDTAEALDALLDCEEAAEGEERAAACEAARSGRCKDLETAATQLRKEVFEPIVDLAGAGWSAGYRFALAELALIEALGPLARANTVLEETCDRDRNAERWRREFHDATVNLVNDLDPGLGDALGQLLRNHSAGRP